MALIPPSGFLTDVDFSKLDMSRFALRRTECGGKVITTKKMGSNERTKSNIYKLQVLNEKDIENFLRDGFLHIKGFYKGEELKTFKKFVDEVQNKPERVGGQMMWFEEGMQGQGRILNRVEDFCRHHKGMSELFTANQSKMRQACADLAGEDVILFKDKINFKLSGGDGFKAHQDQQAGWGNYIGWFLSIAVFADPSTIENGCLEIAGGLHKNGLLGKEWVPIDDLDLPYKYIECAPGDALFFDSYVPHRSGPNTSDKPRRALIMTYNKNSDGYALPAYYADKRASFPPDIERPKGKTYVYRV